MPRLSIAVPKYRKKTVKDGTAKYVYAVVTINGHEHTLGLYGSKASKVQYDRLIAEYIASGRSVRFGVPEHDAMTMRQLIAEYGKWAQGHFVRADGTPTGTHANMRPLMKLLLKLYGSAPVSEFRANAFRAVIAKLIEKGQSISTVNDRIARIKHLFKWGTQREYIEPDQLVSIDSIEYESAGRSKAKPAKIIDAVPDEHVALTLLHLPKMVADMVLLQRLTGMRPDEVCAMKKDAMHYDENGGDACWVYLPSHHKTAHKGKQRAIAFKGAAQDLMLKYMSTAGDGYFFSPQRSYELHLADRSAKRVTPLSCGTTPKQRRKKQGGDRYTSCSYRRAIHRACERLFFGKVGYKWAPNQLRHAAGVETQEIHGDIESVMAQLGHSKAATSRHYAKQNIAKAKAVAGTIGKNLVG